MAKAPALDARSDATGAQGRFLGLVENLVIKPMKASTGSDGSA
jgi:hypothetical protein